MLLMNSKILIAALISLFACQIPALSATLSTDSHAIVKTHDPRPVLDEAFDSVVIGICALGSLLFLPFYCTFALGIAAIAVGAYSRKRIIREPDNWRGKTWAETGLILGLCAFNAPATALFLAGGLCYRGIKQLFKRKKRASVE
jgi:hypothetical protein